MLDTFQIAQRVPVDAGAFKLAADGRKPDGEDGAKEADEDDGRVVDVEAGDGQVGREAVEHGGDEDERRGEEVAGVAERAEVKGPVAREDVRAAAQEDEELGHGVGEVLGGVWGVCC